MSVLVLIKIDQEQTKSVGASGMVRKIWLPVLYYRLTNFENVIG